MNGLNYSIFLVAGVLIGASFLFLGTYRTVVITFRDGDYNPDLVQSAGGVSVVPLESLGMVKASVPAISAALLSIDPEIQSVELDTVSHVQIDYNFSSIAGVTSAEYGTNWGISHIGVEQAHEQGITGKGVRIAELDTGIDYNHPDIAHAYRGGYDFIHNNTDPKDDNGHGTHVAGIIAAAGKGSGEVGVAPDAELYAVKVSDSEGKGSFSMLIEGINWAVEHNMNVITMSITGEGGSPALEQAIAKAHDKYGITVLAAAGNGNGGGVMFPAAYPDVIAVGSLDQKDERSSFSLSGPQLELVAPGSMINSTWLGGHYKVESGTSMATPFVAGTVALILGSNEKAWSPTGLTNGDGNWTADEVRRVLDHMTVHLGTAGKNDQYGFGELKIKFPSQNVTPPVQPESTAASNKTLAEKATLAEPSTIRDRLFGLYGGPVFEALSLISQFM